jgi:hypothetical protein
MGSEHASPIDSEEHTSAMGSERGSVMGIFTSMGTGKECR